ncbi:MAG: hypothetical protein Q4A63_07250 [Butyricicoccus pullicaecorum]|nr:hypothetical protein [Butyricicoccus pullicaecorum]MDO4669599.1 hypothetical protein [Butyricicoccus pullicaecorum]
MALWWKCTEDAHRLSMAELEKENERLHKQVEALEQQAVFHEAIFMELAQEVYA